MDAFSDVVSERSDSTRSDDIIGGFLGNSRVAQWQGSLGSQGIAEALLQKIARSLRGKAPGDRGTHTMRGIGPLYGCRISQKLIGVMRPIDIEFVRELAAAALAFH